MSDLTQVVLGIYLGLFLMVVGIGYVFKKIKDKDNNA